MKSAQFFTISCVFFLSVGCKKQPDDHGHKHGGHGGHDHAQNAGHGHNHAHGDHSHADHGTGPKNTITKWGQNTQLFLEFEPLAKNNEAHWGVHLTRMRDHIPVQNGTLTIELTGGDQPTERFSAKLRNTKGVFDIKFKPKHATKRSITVRIDAPDIIDQHTIGTFEVFANKANAKVTQQHNHAKTKDPISFLLEQQWSVPFGIKQAQPRYIRPNVQVFGQLKPSTNAKVTITAPQDGRLIPSGQRRSVIGEQVKKGVPLFGLHSSNASSNDPAQLTLNVEQARIAVTASKREVDRLTPLVKQGAVAQKRLDLAQDQYNTAVAQLRAAQRQTYRYQQNQRIKSRGDVLTIPSPIDGTIIELPHAYNTRVNKGDVLARVIDRSQLWLHVDVPESYLGKLKDVSGAWFRLDHYPAAFVLGKEDLLFTGEGVEDKTRALPMTFRVNNIRQELFAGMFTRVHLYIGPPKLSLTVHKDAIIDDGGTDVVFVQLDGEHFVRRPVKLGIRDGDYVEVRSGIQPDEWVVTRGGYSVKLAATPSEGFGHGHTH